MKKSLVTCVSILIVMSILLSGCGNGNNSVDAGSTGAAEPSSAVETGAAAPETGSDAESGSAGSTAAANPSVDTSGTYERKTDENSFVYGAAEEPTNLMPSECNLDSEVTIDKCIYDNLFILDSDGDFTGVLAESWEYTDDYTLVIKLKDDIYFTNGAKLTSDDVLFTLEMLANSSIYNVSYTCVDFESTKLVDELTIEVKLNTIYAPFLSCLALPSAGVMCRSYYDEVGADAFGRNPIGTGAFELNSWTAGDRITLTRNEDYWGDKPAYETLVIRFITEDTTRFIEFETGTLDAIGGLSGSDIDRMAAGSVNNAVLITVPGQTITYFELYQGFDYIKDVRVRQAIAHAIDWESVVEVAWGSAAMVADSVFTFDTNHYSSMGVYEYNPELAKSLLEEAGYGDGFEMMIYTQAGEESEATEIIQAMLAEVGITLKIEIVDLLTVITAGINGDVPVGFTSTTNTSRDPDKVISYRKMVTDFTLARIVSQELQDLLDTGSSTVDEDEREKIYLKVQQYFHDNVVTIPVKVDVVGYAVRDYVDYFPANAANAPDLKAVTFK